MLSLAKHVFIKFQNGHTWKAKQTCILVFLVATIGPLYIILSSKRISRCHPNVLYHLRQHSFKDVLEFLVHMLQRTFSLYICRKCYYGVKMAFNVGETYIYRVHVR